MWSSKVVKEVSDLVSVDLLPRLGAGSKDPLVLIDHTLKAELADALWSNVAEVDFVASLVLTRFFAASFWFSGVSGSINDGPYDVLSALW